MDKRWILILVVLLIGLSGLYYTANESAKIGDAITIIDNVIVTLPQNFKIIEKSDTHVEITSRDSDESLYIKYIKNKESPSSLMKKYLNEMKNENIINTTKKISDTIVYEVKDLTSNNTNYYFNKYNKTFIIESKNYDNYDKENSDVKYVIDALRIDFKIKES